MSWSTELFCNISFNRQTYNSLYEVEDKIDELEKCIEQCKRELRDLAFITEPSKFLESEDETPYSFIDRTFKENIELLEEYFIELNDLKTLRYYWDKCHTKDGLAIPCPDNVHWDSAFLDGDFIKTTKDGSDE